MFIAVVDGRGRFVGHRVVVVFAWGNRVEGDVGRGKHALDSFSMNNVHEGKEMR